MPGFGPPWASVDRVVALACLVSFSLGTLPARGDGGVPGPQGSQVERGRYLANGITRCFWCHSPLDDGNPASPRPESLGSGDVLDDKKPVNAPNLTPDPETGIGRWSDAEIVRAIREGIGRDGRRLRSDHPATYYSVMTDGDAAAIAAYLRSLRSIRRALPRSAPARRASGESVQAAVPPAEDASLRSTTSRGAYLAQLGECRGCHTPTTRDGAPFRGMEWGGGRRFRVVKGVGIELDPDPSFTPAARAGAPSDSGLVASANITRDPSGIAFYTEEVFLQTIRTGHVAGVRALSAAMPWVFFRSMTDEDLRAIFAYLATLPPVRHRVSNFDPPTFCALCGRRHGLGELNSASSIH